jgi:CubicO group peptidase (beta-lactamase class C family)
LNLGGIGHGRRFRLGYSNGAGELMARLAVIVALIVFGLLAGAPAVGVAQAPRYDLDCERAHGVSRGARGIALIVLHADEIACELYVAGVEPEESWEIASGVKSFTAMMAAAAVQDGLLTLDELAADTLTEWQDNERAGRITVRHLLSQTSGLAVNRNARRVPSYADAIRAPIVREPGESFAYGPRHFQAFGELLRRKLTAAGLDPTPAHYFQRRVLAPLGARVSNWGAVDGMPVLSENAAVSPMDWARFGYLVAQGGQLGSDRLVDPEAFAAQFQPTPAYPVYGMGWWLPHPRHADQTRGVFLDTVEADDDFPILHVAAGAGGQRLYILPELDLVVVRMTRGVTEDPSTQRVNWSDRAFLEALLRPVEDPS